MQKKHDRSILFGSALLLAPESSVSVAHTIKRVDVHVN
jgi:hypothetical protein